MWVGSVGKKPKEANGIRTNAEVMNQDASPYGTAGQVASPYGTAGQAASLYGTAGQAASLYGTTPASPPPPQYGTAGQVASPYGTAAQAHDTWSNFDSDKGGDSPSGTQIAAVKSLGDTESASERTLRESSETGGRTGGRADGSAPIQNNGGVGDIIMGDQPRQKLNICNSTRNKDYGNVYDSNGKFVKKYTPSQILEACKNTFQYNCGEQYCKQSYSDYEKEKLEDEPAVETEMKLTGQKGGDECVYTEDQIKQIRYDLAKAEQALLRVESKIASKGRECNTIQKVQKERGENNNKRNLTKICRTIIKKENTAGKKLKNLQKGTVSYSKQLDYVYELRNEVKACFRKNRIKTEYKRMFITQMYDSNEYEGDISVFDKNWNKGDELIHDCDD